MPQMDGGRLIIFTATKKTADDLTVFFSHSETSSSVTCKANQHLLSWFPSFEFQRDLRQDGFPARAIHGDKSQDERDWVLQVFYLFIILFYFIYLFLCFD